MKLLVVYDSVFGNTEKVAQTIGTALAEQAEVIVRKVTDVQGEDWQNLDALIVGSPTRAFKATPTMMKRLQAIPAHGLQGVKAAVFDTRADLATVNSKFLETMVKVFGYANQPMAKLLEKKGAVVYQPLGGFFVVDSEGPLKDGELDRAVAWAKHCLG